jgi:hypothetical protein
MSLFSSIGKGFILADIALGNALPVWAFSGFGHRGYETISSKCGKEQLYQLILMVAKDKSLSYPIIPLHHPLGQIADDLCMMFEPYHCLKHIQWDRGVDMEAIYPGCRKLRDRYLASKGIKA